MIIIVVFYYYYYYYYDYHYYNNNCSFFGCSYTGTNSCLTLCGSDLMFLWLSKHGETTWYIPFSSLDSFKFTAKS